MASTSDMTPIKWDCVYCGRALGGFALTTQVALGPLDGIDYCRKCVARARFAEHLEQASETVRTWPRWKQAVLGDIQMSPTAEPTEASDT